MVSLSKIEGFEIIGADETGEVALLEVSMEPDAILVNIELPDMKGAKFIRQVKTKHPAIQIIALFVTDEEEQILEAVQAGTDVYCLEHTLPERLVEAVYTVNEGHARIGRPLARRLISTMADGQRSSSQVLGKQSLVSGKSYQMTDRELQIPALIVAGKSNDDIAKALNVSYHTVKSDVTQIFLKLGVQDRVQTAVKALVEGVAACEMKPAVKEKTICA